MRILGLDIGGANVKASTADGECLSIPFPIWQKKEGLREVLSQLPYFRQLAPQIVAVTMTAELADCFISKADGVAFVINTVVEAFPNSLIRIWLTSGEFAEPLDAIELPELAGASNWHALATWAGRAIPTGPALVIDIGSTTTDIIPLVDGCPVPEGRTDLERLAASELLYTGIHRTPVCAIVRSVPLINEEGSGVPVFVPVAAEVFATALDVHLLNGDIPPNEKEMETADGRPATRTASFNRLAHMLCCDASELSEVQLLAIAAHVADQQLEQICEAIRNRVCYLEGLTSSLTGIKTQIVLSGSGTWMSERAIRRIGEDRFGAISNLVEMFVRNVTASAPAFAVARLAAERCLDDLLPCLQPSAATPNSTRTAE